MASIQKRGPYQHQAIVRRKGHPTQTRTFDTRKDAEAWVRDIESKMDKGIFKDRKEVEETTLGEALDRYLEQVTCYKRSRVSEENRIKLLKQHPLASRSLGSLQAKDFARYRDQRLKEVSPNTVRLELALLSHLYTIAIKEWSLPLDHEPRNIRKPKPGPGRERRLQGDEEARLFKAIQQLKTAELRVWLEACVRLALETGMRAGEILGMNWSQINLPSQVIRLTITKNGSQRSVPLTPVAVQILKDLPRHISGRVIPNFYDTSGLDRAFKKACEIAEIEGLRFHDLRHEAASRLAPHLPAATLAKIMGWKTIQMAMRYYNPTEEELVRAISLARCA